MKRTTGLGDSSSFLKKKTIVEEVDKANPDPRGTIGFGRRIEMVGGAASDG